MPFPNRDNTPKNSTGTIRAFCRTISSETPVYLKYTDTNYGYESTHCYDNVRHYVKHHGGEMLSGWIIWVNTIFKIEAEHHAVWKAPSGNIYDITPRVDGEEEILFLPDPARPYDFKNTWLNRHNSNPALPCHYNGIPTTKEKIPYSGVHPYHEWIAKLPGNTKNHLESEQADMAYHERCDIIDMSKTVETQGPDTQGKFSIIVSVGGLTTTFSGFSSKMEAQDYAVSFLRRVQELAKEDGLTIA